MFNRLFPILNHFSKLKINYRDMSTKKVRIGVCQLNCRDNKEENFEIGARLIKEAKQDQAKVSLKKSKRI